MVFFVYILQSDFSLFQCDKNFQCNFQCHSFKVIIHRVLVSTCKVAGVYQGLSRKFPEVYFPTWIQCYFCERDYFTSFCSLRDTGFTTLSVPVKVNHVKIIVTYCTILWCNLIIYSPALWNYILMILYHTRPAKNTPFFFSFSTRGHGQKYHSLWDPSECLCI